MLVILDVNGVDSDLINVNGSRLVIGLGSEFNQNRPQILRKHIPVANGRRIELLLESRACLDSMPFKDKSRSSTALGAMKLKVSPDTTLSIPIAGRRLQGYLVPESCDEMRGINSRIVTRYMVTMLP